MRPVRYNVAASLDGFIAGTALELEDTHTYPSGMVTLSYRVPRWPVVQDGHQPPTSI